MDQLVFGKENTSLTLQERVAIIEKVQKVGLPPDLLTRLYVLAKDQQVSYIWWEWLCRVVDEEIYSDKINRESEIKKTYSKRKN